jgi:hypothetical protein
VNRTKKDLWLRLREYHFDHVVPPNFCHQVVEAFGGTDGPTKAFADKLARKLGWSTEFALRAIDEYKKFVYLGMVSDFIVTPSKIIDHVWHEHQLFTQAYRQFCAEVLGRHFDHNPELIPIDDQTGIFQAQYFETLALYRKEFNREAPDDIWSIPKFRSGAGKGHYEPGRKRTVDSGAGAVGRDDMPLYMCFDGEAHSDPHSAFDGFDGGRSGGAGAGASWSDDPQHESDSLSDSGSLGAETDSASDGGGESCGGSSCSSSCGGDGGE